jgi:uncharacterized protein
MSPTRRETLAMIAISLTAAAAPAQSGAPLWVVSRGGSKVYLFGQTPVKTATPWLSARIEEAFAQSRELWVENPEFDRAAAGALIQKRLAEGGPSLAELLTPADLRRLRRAAQRGGQPPASLDGQPPWLAYLSLSDLADRLAGTDPAALPERVLKARAVQAGKPIRSEWESFEAVMRFSAEASPAAQLQLIRKTLDDVEAAPRIDRALSAWASGDLSRLEAADALARSRYPDLHRRIVAQRNSAWAGRIEDMLAQLGAAFVCVGVGHLVGPRSIQAYLAEAGLRALRL